MEALNVEGIMKWSQCCLIVATLVGQGGWIERAGDGPADMEDGMAYFPGRDARVDYLEYLAQVAANRHHKLTPKQAAQRLDLVRSYCRTMRRVMRRLP